jgi:hypothetical protein
MLSWGARIMVMTSDSVRYDLARIDALISALNGGSSVDPEDEGDLRWLWKERAALLRLLVSRRAQCGKRIVSLAEWRDGDFGRPARRSKAA